MNTEALALTLDPGARRYGDEWHLFCFVHEADGRRHHRSLSIRDKNGKTLLHCWAGCSQRELIQALRDRGLWSAERTPSAPRFDWRDHLDRQFQPLPDCCGDGQWNG